MERFILTRDGKTVLETGSAKMAIDCFEQITRNISHSHERGLAWRSRVLPAPIDLEITRISDRKVVKARRVW